MADRDDLRRALLPVVDVDEPVVIRMRHEPGPAAARLLVTLGVGWVVDENAPPCVRRCGHRACRVTVAPQVSAHEILQTRSCVQPGAHLTCELEPLRCDLAALEFEDARSQGQLSATVP